MFTTDDREYPVRARPARRAGARSHLAVRVRAAARAEAETLRARADQELAERQNDRAGAARERSALSRAGGADQPPARADRRAVRSGDGRRPSPRRRRAGRDRRRRDLRRSGCCTSKTGRLRDDHTDVRRRAVRAGRRRVSRSETGFCATEVVADAAAGLHRHRSTNGRSATGDRRRSRPMAGTCRRRRCRCWSTARAIGVLAFHFTAPVNFDEEYQALLVSVAQHCAQALDRARLYESAQQARSRSGSGQPAQGRVRFDRVARSAHAAERDARLDGDAAEGRRWSRRSRHARCSRSTTTRRGRRS